MLADIVLPGRRFQVFTYQIPPHIFSHIHVGIPVTVPLGAAVVSGLVVSVFERQSEASLQKRFQRPALRNILSVEMETDQPPLGHNLFQLVEKISAYYLYPLSACLRLIVPPHVVKMIKRK